MDGQTQAQTTFHFDPDGHLDVDNICLHLDRGGNKSSPEESLLAPFYQDASQRIVTVELDQCDSIFVMKTEVLLELAREQGDANLEWEQRKAHAAEVQSSAMNFRVSGPRLFCACWPEDQDARTRLDVYDFSARVSARHMKTATDKDGRFLRVMWPSVKKYHLLWDLSLRDSSAGHDSLAILTANIPYSQNLTKV